MALGERIRQRRRELGWTQDTLMRKAGISKGFLSDLENGKRGVGADTLLDISRVLGLSLDYLMTGSGAKGKKSEAEDVEIPAALARFAAEAGISFRQTLVLLDVLQVILANRGSAKKQSMEKVDWPRFYEAIKDFL